MEIIGLTGSVAVGKSAVSKVIKSLGYSVFDADAGVACLFKNSEFLLKLKLDFPQAFANEIFQKDKLRKLVFSDSKKLQKLENIIHPLVYSQALDFIQQHQQKNLIFLEIPLLFEQSYQNICDKVIVVYTDEKIQKERFLQRDNMTLELWYQITNNQMPQDSKIELADYLIYNNDTHVMLMNKIITLIEKLNKL